MTLDDILDKHGAWKVRDSDDHLPCFAHRFRVWDEMNTPTIIKNYIKYAVENSDNDVIVFSVTELDKCWNAWADFAEAHPKTFQVVQGGSIHGKYQCRMYIYTKPVGKRKFAPKNIGNYRAR